MIDDQLVLRIERLRDAVEALRDDLHARYRTPQRPVVSRDVRQNAARLGERWLVEVGAREDVRAILGDDLLADLSVEFQRLITYSEAATIRRRYDTSLKAILRDFRTQVVIPLKQNRGTAARPQDRRGGQVPLQVLDCARVELFPRIGRRELIATTSADAIALCDV